MFSFISFHAKKYRVTSECGGEGPVLAVHQDAQIEARSVPSATVFMQLALNQDSVGTAAPLSLPASWEPGCERTLSQSSSIPWLSPPALCSLLPTEHPGTSRLCFWNHRKALGFLLPKWKDVPAKPFPDAETPIVPG